MQKIMRFLYTRYYRDLSIYVGKTNDRVHKRQEEHERDPELAGAEFYLIHMLSVTEKELAEAENAMMQQFLRAGFRLRNKRLPPSATMGPAATEPLTQAAALALTGTIRKRYGMPRNHKRWPAILLAGINVAAAQLAGMPVPLEGLIQLPQGNGALIAWRTAGQKALRASMTQVRTFLQHLEPEFALDEVTDNAILQRWDKTNRYPNECLWTDAGCAGLLEAVEEAWNAHQQDQKEVVCTN